MPRPEEEEAAGLEITPEEQPHQRWKEGRPQERLLKESLQEALGKDSKLVQLTGQAYFKMHCSYYDHKGSLDISHTFKEMVTSAGLLGYDVHEVQQVWTGQKDLQVTHCVAESSPKGICFFWVVPSTESPKIMGLKGIHSPKALRWQSGLSFCPWCGNEGQNEGTVVNHLRTSHYHLGLICDQCLEYLMMSAYTMHCHLQLCKPALASVEEDDNEDQEGESDIDDNGEDNDEFVFG